MFYFYDYTYSKSKSKCPTGCVCDFNKTKSPDIIVSLLDKQGNSYFVGDIFVVQIITVIDDKWQWHDAHDPPSADFPPMINCTHLPKNLNGQWLICIYNNALYWYSYNLQQASNSNAQC